MKKKIFQEHICSIDQKGIQNCTITLIEQVDNEEFLEQRELFWALKLDTFFPYGLNERQIYAAYLSQGFLSIGLITVRILYNLLLEVELLSVIIIVIIDMTMISIIIINIV